MFAAKSKLGVKADVNEAIECIMMYFSGSPNVKEYYRSGYGNLISCSKKSSFAIYCAYEILFLQRITRVFGDKTLTSSYVAARALQRSAPPCLLFLLPKEVFRS